MSNGLSELVDKEKEGRPDSAFEAAHPPVIGVARPNDKVGIFGVHKAKGAGVAGFSESGEGVRAQSEGGNGIDSTGALNGVVGRTKAAQHSGILGLHGGGGRAVTGVSDALGGIGVHGKGAHLAGFFEGDVEVTGNLTVRDATVQALEQRISDLEQQLREVLERLDATEPRSISPLPEILGGVGIINGNGFSPNHSVTVRIIDGDGLLRELSTMSNIDGRIHFLIATTIPLPFTAAATDGTKTSRNLTGKRWSNTLVIRT